MHEESIRITGSLPDNERGILLDPMIVGSKKIAADQGRSLALIRPRNTRFISKKKSVEEIQEQRAAFERSAKQKSFFDKELAQIEPSPYDFRFLFEDDAGKHNCENGDWECHATFWKRRQNTNEVLALEFMNDTFNSRYPKAGMVFAMGNQAKRPHTWQLLGVIRLNETTQGQLF